MQTKTKVQLSTVSYIINYVKDTKKAVEFYRDTLGMTVKVDSPEWVEFETGSATTLALHKSDESPAKTESTELVFAVEDIFEAYKQLKEKGVKFCNEPMQVCEEGDKVGYSATFSDIDGNRLAIYSMVPKKDGMMPKEKKGCC